MKGEVATMQEALKNEVGRSRIIWSNTNLDNYNYGEIIKALNSNSTTTKLKALDEFLLDIQIVDTKQPLWGSLAEILQKCFVSLNNEIFLRTLKIHHRLILFPNSTCDGYLNLLNGTFLLINSRYFNDSNTNRVLQALRLILNAHNFVIKILLHANHGLIDQIVTAFVKIICFKHMIDFFHELDPQSEWLSNFYYASYIRESFFTHLPLDFISLLVFKFLNNLNSDDKLIPGAQLVVFFLSHQPNISQFPLKMEDRGEIKLNYLLESMISRLSRRKKPEMVDLTVNLVKNNPKLLNEKLLYLIIQPLVDINRNNVRNVIEANEYVFIIIGNVAQSANFHLIFGNKFHNRRFKNRTNLSQKVIDVSVMYLKNCTGQSDDVINEKLTVNILQCCRLIYQCHSVALIYVNPSKLLTNLNDFYKLMNWKNGNHQLRREILNLFIYFHSNYWKTIQTLDFDNDILTDLFSFCPIDDLKLVVLSVVNHKTGFEFVKNHKVLKTYLEELWYLDECDSEVDFSKFLLFLFVVKFNTRTIKALLSDDSERTVVDKSVALGELIEKGFDSYDESIEAHVGLLAMKVIITNLDLLLYLDVNHQMQKRIQQDNNIIIDMNSSLRLNISRNLEVIGFTGSKIYENILDQSEFQHELPIFELVVSPENELGVFLRKDLKNQEFGWFKQARRAFRASLESFNPGVLIALLEQIPKTYVYRKIDLVWPPQDSVYYQLHQEDFHGITLMINYGLRSGLIKSANGHEEALGLLIKQSRLFMGHQPEEFSNFDWFVGVIYLVCSGDVDKCKEVLVDFTSTQVTALVWATFAKEFDTSSTEHFYQHLLVVLEENCTSYQALNIIEVNPQIFVQSWLNQCFFNYLPFPEICNFLAFAVLYPPECLLYYMVALFQFLYEKISVATYAQSIENILLMNDVSSFRLCDYISMIDKMMTQYRNTYKL